MTIRKLTSTLLALAAASLLLPDDFSAVPQLHAAKKIAAVRGATKSALKRNKTSDDSPLADLDHKWYLSLSADYFNAGGGGSHMDTFSGAGLTLGYLISNEDRVQLEIGYTTGSYNGNFSWNMPVALDGVVTLPNGATRPLTETVRMTGSAGAKATLMPILLSYSYSVRPLSSPKFGFLSTDRLALRLNPVLGAFAIKGTWTLEQLLIRDPNNPQLFLVDQRGRFQLPTKEPFTLTYSGYQIPGDPIHLPGWTGGTTVILHPMSPMRGSNSWRLVATVGIGGGLTYDITPRLFLEFDYRFLWVAKAVNSPPVPEWNGRPETPWSGKSWTSLTAWNGINTTQYKLSLGYKF